MVFSDRYRPAVAAVAIAAGLVASSLPANAQFFGDRYPDQRSYPDQRYYQPAPRPRDFFSFPFGNGFIRPPAPVVDSTHAPPPRKLETPPATTVAVIGDSMADWLAYGLDELYADQPDIGFERKVRAYSGLIRYDSKNETLDWSEVTKEALASEKPSAIIVMLGLNDRLSLRDGAPPRSGAPKTEAPTGPAAPNPAQQQTPAAAGAETPPDAAAAEPRPIPGHAYEFHTDQWAELYGKRIDDMIAAVKSKGVPVLWVGLPALRGTKSTGDMSYLDELYREHAEKAGITYVDIWDGFVDDQGRYAVQGPDFEGQTRRLRTADGVHFTKAGAVKLASYVDRELRRALSGHVVPVSLPGPEATAPAKTGARPDVGPVVPLTASVGEAHDLLGAAGHAAPAIPDPVAAKVLSQGDALAAPAGRADNFSWPPPAADAAPQPAALTPAPSPEPDSGKKPADAKKDTKAKPTADANAAKPRPSSGASLDGAPRPPKDIGRGH